MLFVIMCQYQISYMCTVTNLHSNQMKNTYICTLQIVVSDGDSAVASRLCKTWNDPQYTTADGQRFAYQGCGEHILYRHKRYPYCVRQSRQKCVNVSEIEIGCNKSINIKFSVHGSFLKKHHQIPSLSKCKFSRCVDVQCHFQYYFNQIAKRVLRLIGDSLND